MKKRPLDFNKAHSNKDFLKQRNEGIGSSDAAVIVGASKYKTIYELWEEKTGRAVEQVIGPEEQKLLMWGKRLENFIANDYEIYRLERDKEVVTVKKDTFTRVLPDMPFLRANLDRLVIGDKRSPFVILEAKSTGVLQYQSWETEYPIDYYWQVQQQMLVTGIDHADLAVQVDRQPLKIYRIEKSDQAHQMLREAARRFWDYVIKDEPPPKDIRDFRKSKDASGELVTTNQSVLKIVEDYRVAKALESEAKAKAEEAYERLAKVLQDNDTLLFKVDGQEYPIVTWKKSVRTNLESKLIKLEHPEIFEKYSNKTVTRTMLVKDKYLEMVVNNIGFQCKSKK